MVKEASIKSWFTFIFLLITCIFAAQLVQYDYGIQPLLTLRQTHAF